MATCVLSGTLVDSTATGINGATITANTITPAFDAAGTSLIVPKEVSTTSNSSGAWSLTLEQGMSVTLTIDYPPNTTDSVKRYNYNFVVPAAATQVFNSTFITEL